MVNLYTIYCFSPFRWSGPHPLLYHLISYGFLVTSSGLAWHEFWFGLARFLGLVWFYYLSLYLVRVLGRLAGLVGMVSWSPDPLVWFVMVSWTPALACLEAHLLFFAELVLVIKLLARIIIIIILTPGGGGGWGVGLSSHAF